MVVSRLLKTVFVTNRLYTPYCIGRFGIGRKEEGKEEKGEKEEGNGGFRRESR